MPLLVNLQHLAKDSVVLEGELDVKELDLGVEDEMVQANSPLKYSLQVEKLDDSVLVQGQLMLTLDCQCVRCLKTFLHPLELSGWACHLPLSGEDAVPVSSDCVDLTPQIREDILLGFPQHPRCKPECGGLMPGPGGRTGKPTAPQSGTSSATWSELDKFKLK